MGHRNTTDHSSLPLDKQIERVLWSSLTTRALDKESAFSPLRTDDCPEFQDIAQDISRRLLDLGIVEDPGDVKRLITGAVLTGARTMWAVLDTMAPILTKKHVSIAGSTV